MQTLQILICWYFCAGVITSQNLNPAVIVSKENGEMSSKMAYIGFLGCGDNSSSPQTNPTNSLEVKMNQLEGVIQSYAVFIMNLTKQNGILENKLEVMNQNYAKSSKRIEDLETTLAQMNTEVVNLHKINQKLSSIVGLQNSSNSPGIVLQGKRESS